MAGRSFNLREEILQEHSKSQCEKIVKWIGNDQMRFDSLFRLFVSAEYRVVQRAAWPLSYCVIKNPGFIKKHWAALVSNLQKPGLHAAVKRNSIRLLQNIAIPEKYQGAIMDICFRYIENPREAVAIKAFSITVLKNLSKQYPEILPELRLLLEDQMPHQTPAFRVRAKTILR
jgi:hypothetical protein